MIPSWVGITEKKEGVEIQPGLNWHWLARDRRLKLALVLRRAFVVQLLIQINEYPKIGAALALWGKGRDFWFDERVWDFFRVFQITVGRDV